MLPRRNTEAAAFRRRPLARTGTLRAAKTSSPKKVRRRPWCVLVKRDIHAALCAAR